MVKDHYEAFLFIKGEAIKKRKLSIELIKETGAYIMKHTGGIINSIAGEFDSSKGDLRLVQVYVDKKYFPDYTKVPDLLKKLIENITGRIDEVSKGNEVLKLAADLHYNFVNIH